MKKKKSEDSFFDFNFLPFLEERGITEISKLKMLKIFKIKMNLIKTNNKQKISFF